VVVVPVVSSMQDVPVSHQESMGKSSSGSCSNENSTNVDTNRRDNGTMMKQQAPSRRSIFSAKETYSACQEGQHWL